MVVNKTTNTGLDCPRNCHERLKVRGSKRKAKSFKDEEFYISSVPINQHLETGLSVRANQGFESSRLDAAVLDLVGDDSSGLQKQKSVYHWDKRSKKYIKLNNGERVTAAGKIKTESGSKAKAGKTGIYKKWKERSHIKITLNGVPTDGNAEESTQSAGNHWTRGPDRNFKGNRWTQGPDRNFKGGGRKHWSMPNSSVPSELRDPDQVRKRRQQMANKTSYSKNKSSKGKKFGKNGNRGKRK